MNGGNILLCCDHKETALAETLSEFITKILPGNLQVELCITPDGEADRDNWREIFGDGKEYGFIFFLCSPYAIGQQWLNFISGVATFHAGKDTRIIPLCHSGQKSKDLPHYLLSRQALEIEGKGFIKALISLLAPKDYGLSDFREAEFNKDKTKIESLCQAIKGDGFEPLVRKEENSISWLNGVLEVPGLYLRIIKEKCNATNLKDFLENKGACGSEGPVLEDLEKGYLEKLEKDYVDFKRLHDLKELNRRMLEMAYGAPQRGETPLSFRYKLDQTTKMIVSADSDFPGQACIQPSQQLCTQLFTLTKVGGVITISEFSPASPPDYSDEKNKLNKINEMNDFIQDKRTFVDGVEIAIGIQHCLFDGNNVYIGLNRTTVMDFDFCSFCGRQGIFDPGYALIEEWNGKIKNYHKPIVKISEDVYQILQRRLTMARKKLWTLQLAGPEKTALATVLVNNSAANPRFEIGIWQFRAIKISDISKYQPEAVPEASEERFTYWIWVKNGEICYWSFPEEKYIPKYYFNEERQQALSGKVKIPVLVSTEYLWEVYGWPERYTPFAPDDVLGIENVVKERFSAAARALLSIF